MNDYEIGESIKTMTILVDTREQPTRRFTSRMDAIGLPWERTKLNAGDYSCKCLLLDGRPFNASDLITIERKMSIDELAMCFGKERKRFQAEFERAKETGTKIYLLVEDATWEKIYNHSYQSLMTPQALEASIDAFRARYGMTLEFCKNETTGKRIRGILQKELKEILKNEL